MTSVETVAAAPPFAEFASISRLSRDMIVSEKIDGTNAQVHVTEDGRVLAGSRNRWITPDADNFGFARWVAEHEEELKALGPGSHYGEWWGSGIQRRYGLTEKRFSLFNVGRWTSARNLQLLDAIGHDEPSSTACATPWARPPLPIDLIRSADHAHPRHDPCHHRRHRGSRCRRARPHEPRGGSRVESVRMSADLLISDNGFPRAIRVNLAVEAERAIRHARTVCETTLPGDDLETDAVILLSKALDKVSQLVDREIRAGRMPMPERAALGEPHCPKAPHDNPNGGYLHGADDDSPYSVDGVRYCGRCHYMCDATGRCENPARPPAGEDAPNRHRGLRSLLDALVVEAREELDAYYEYGAGSAETAVHRNASVRLKATILREFGPGGRHPAAGAAAGGAET